MLARSAWLPPRQRDRVARVVEASTAKASGPFESSLRAIALRVSGLAVEPQVRLRRKAFDRDCRRYNGLVTRGWLVLRFTWEQVMFEPDVLRRAIEDAVALRRSQGRRRLRTGRAGWELREPRGAPCRLVG